MTEWFWRRRGRRLVNGTLVNDDDRVLSATNTQRRRIYYGRLVVVVLAMIVLIASNPSHEKWINRIPQAWDYSFSKQRSKKSNFKSLTRQPSTILDEFSDSMERLYKLYKLSTLQDDDLQKQGSASSLFLNEYDTTDGTMVNYLLFSVRVVTRRSLEPQQQKQHLEFLGAGRIFSQCRLDQNAFLCRTIHDILLLPYNPSPTRCSKHNKPQKVTWEQLWLSFQPNYYQNRRYFRVYQLLMGWIVTALIIHFVVPPQYTSAQELTIYSPHPLREILARAFWPNPLNPISSTIVALFDLWCFMAPALALMDDQIANQAPQSFFHLFSTKGSGGGDDSAKDWNYAAAVMVFLVASMSLANLFRLFLVTGGNLLTDVTSTLRPQNIVGYNCDVWAASALGYIRAFCGSEDNIMSLALNPYECLTFSLGGYHCQFTIVSAIWLRIAIQLLVVNGQSLSSSSLATIGLWFTTDSISYMIGQYQMDHHFATVAVSNFFHQVDRFFTSLFLGGGGHGGW